MAAAPPGTVLRYLRGLAVADQTRLLTDAHLLRRFVDRREEDVFAALVERHGQLVWSVCRHVLGDDHDADDAFQATFVVLAHKAGAIRDGACLAGWLQATAYRVALRAKRDAAIRRNHERRGQPMPAAQSLPESVLREALALLDEEVEKLPARQRAVFALCCLEGKSQAEAARQLGWKEGTVSGTLARARQRLRQRLTRRGVTLSAVLTALALDTHAGSAALPAGLARTTARAVLRSLTEGATGSPAAALAAGMLRGMTLVKTKAVTGIFLAMFLALGAGLLALPSEMAQQPPPAVRPQEAAKRVDFFGDPLPQGALARLGTVRFRHGDRIYSEVITPDGKTLASRGFDGAVRLWDTGSGKELARVDLPYPGDWTNTLSLSPDGKHLATATWVENRNRILVWDVAERKLARRMDLPDASRLVTAVSFAEEGKTLAGVFGETVCLWDAATGRELRRFVGHAGVIEALAISPDGKTLATGARDGTVRLWEAATGRQQGQFPRKLALRPDFERLPGLPPAQQRGILSLAFAPDGRALAVSASGEKTFCVWDLEANKELPPFRGDSGEVTTLLFLHDGKTLVSGAWNGLVHLWDVANRKEIRQFRGGDSPVLSLALSRDGKALAVGGLRTVRLWDPSGNKDLRPLPGHHEGVMQIAFSPDGKTAATGVGSWDQRVCLWDTATGKELRQLQAPSGGLQLLRFSPDGRTLTVCNDGLGLTLHSWETATGRRLTLRDFKGSGSFLPSPGGRVIAAAEGKTTLLLWDRVTGKEERLTIPPSWSGRVVSPDGKFLAYDAADQSGTITLRDLKTGQDVHRCQGYPRSLSAFTFSPDGKYLAAAFHFEPRVVVIWETATGRKVAECRGGDEQTTFMALAFSPDGKTLAAGDDRSGTVRLWEVVTGGERHTFRGHVSCVRALAFSPDGRRLASGGEDTLGMVWDLGEPKTPKREGDSLWNDLASADAAVAYRASRALIGQGADGVGLLEKHLKPVVAVPAKQLTDLIADLNSEQFAVRQKATQTLEELADAAELALRKALESDSPLEVRRRVEGLLSKLVLTRSPGRMRLFRAVETLEFLGTPEARRLLERLAGGAPGALLTREARASLARLTTTQ
jgi:RNA polymerase sigma factor (sigma-70 family)